jgi:hypothetical protein
MEDYLQQKYKLYFSCKKIPSFSKYTFVASYKINRLEAFFLIFFFSPDIRTGFFH